MQKKYFNFQPKGMNTNMSFKFQSNEYATYMKNIRLTEDNNGVLSLQFEKGNTKLLDISGTPIGVCILNKYLIIFTHSTRLKGTEISSTTDNIYRIEIKEDTLNKELLFSGNLNFDTNHPIETLGVYENENIQKVYFIDGKNQARVINIVYTYRDRIDEYERKNISINLIDKSLDFIAELQLQEHIVISKILGNGSFPQGTIQYVFSYYNKNGRQSNLFYQSPLQYLSYASGVSPEDKVNCSFKLKIYNPDKQFDYLRIYSIIRTSQDATPTVKRVVDLSISDTNKNKTSLSKVSTLNTGSNLDDFGKTMEVTNIAKFEQIDNYNNGLYVQGAVCYGKYLFQAYIGGKFIDIIDLETNQKQALLIINIDVNTRAYHGNVLSFGKDIAPGSNFPYLYYSCENNSNPQILVIKITSSNADSNQWTGELVQTIYLPESNGGNSQNGSTDISTTFKHYYQNGCIDTENNCIWVSGYTMESFNSNIGAYDNNKLIYRKYELPSVSEKKVYFSYNNVLDSFILPFKKGTQGMVIRNNKLYQCFGYDKGDVYDEFLDCINLSTKQIFHSYQFPKTQLAGLGEELESPYIYKNNLYLSATVNSWRYYTLWSISFNGGGDIIVPPEPPIPEEKADISFIDNGSIGDIIDPTELLYLGGNTICPNTFEQKDGTLFIGNYTINNNDISEETAIKIRNLLSSKLGFKYKATSIFYKGKNDYYNYEGQLGESDVAGFKYMEWYGVAIQFQNKNGRFSSPIYLGSTRNYFPSRIVDYNLSEVVGVNRGELNLDINITELAKIVDTNIWVKARLLIVNPTNNLKTVLCQGIISSTVFNYRDRYNNAPFTMSSWRMNSLGKHLKPLFANSISWGEVQNIEFSKSPIIGGNSTTRIIIKCIMRLSHYRTIVVSEDTRVLYDNTSPTIIKAKENLKKWNANIDITKIPDDSWKNNANIIQEIKINDVDTIVNDFGECFAYDESLVTFNSPDIENQYNNINKKAKLRIIGILKSNPLFSNYLIQGSDLNDSSKGNVPTKNIKDFTSALLWRDMDSSWDNLGDYDANKDWLFATYLWHRETSYSDNGIEKKNSNGNSRKVWSKPVKKIISNTRECTTSYLRDSLSYINDIEEINKFNYYELPIDDIKVITTNRDVIYKLNSNMGDSYTETLSYTSDTNKLFPTNNEYPIYGQQYYAYKEDSISDYIIYNTIIVDGKAVTSKDPVRIKYKETPHAIISFGSKNNSTIKLPRMSIKHKSEIDRVGEDAVVRKLFWNTENNSYTKDFIWTKYINEYANYMNPTNIETNYFFYNANPSINDYYYLADLCVQDPDTSPYELSNGNKDIISQYSFIPAGEAIELIGDTISLRGNHGDTYYQRWDCLKTFPYSTDDKNQYIDITSFFVESRINLDGRYDKQRGLKYNLGVLNTNFNLINKSYTQRNNFFNYRQIEDEGVINFPNQITISKTKVLGEDVDSWTNVTLASVFDLDGDKGKLNAIRKINNDLYCFQDNGISRLLYNSRVQVNTSDGVPIEIANSAKLQDKQYLSDSIGCQNKWAIKSTSSGIYFIDNYNGGLYKLTSNGIESISNNKMKNYFSSLPIGEWSPNNITAKIDYDDITKDLYIITKDSSLAYNEFLGEFTSFYSYNPLYIVNLQDKSLQLQTERIQDSALSEDITNIWESYKGNYGSFYGSDKAEANVEFIANGDFDSDKVFETVELTTSDIAKINNWKADCYPFDTLEVSNEYQRGKNEASSINVKKKFRTWRWQIPRNSKKNEDGIITNRDRIRNMWAKIKLSKKYNSPLSIYDINVAYYS
jgi:hypothetical protein